MGAKTDRNDRGLEQVLAQRGCRQIRKDLEVRGVDAETSALLATRLELELEPLSAAEYNAALDGVAATCDVCQADADCLERYGHDVDEIQRLMQGFAGELRKLEEGLRIVSAYVLRMHDKASQSSGRLVH